MIKRSAELKIDFKEHMRDGKGTVKLTHFINSPEELYEKGRLFAKITLEPNCGIGLHNHETESELFYILSGTADYNDNGTEVQVSAGDVTICKAGECHAIANHTNETVELIAVIIYA